MTPQSDLPEVDRVVFETPSIRVGAFRCPADHPLFADSGPIREHCFVFPRTAVVIQHREGRPFASDPNIVTLYNRGQEYRRRPVALDGDRCDWYAVSDEILRDALAGLDRLAADDPQRPIRFAFARTDARTYWLQRQLFASIDDSRTQPAKPDSLYVEEAVCELLDRVLSAAYGRADETADATVQPRTADDLAHDARALLGRRFAEPLSLVTIASLLESSPFHLCRSFRRATGTTLHSYRNELRLRTALDSLEQADCDLCALALELGYSSHSHFTAAFRRAFGATPSSARRRICATS